MKKIKTCLLALLLIPLLLSCTAHHQFRPGYFAGEKFEVTPVLTRGETGSEVEQVLEMAYGNDFDFHDLKEKVYEALDKYPDNGDLHEVAAFIQLLNSDNRQFFYHLVKAASDLENGNTLTYLRLINSIVLTYQENEIFIELLEQLAGNHNNFKVVRFSEALLAEKYLNKGDCKRNKAFLQKRGVIEEWKMIGTFDNDNGKGFYEQYPPEREIDFNASYKGKVADAVWRTVPGIDRSGKIPLGQFLYPNIDTAAYLYTVIEKEEDKEALLLISAGDSIKVWLNGTEIIAEENVEFFAFDNISLNIDLKKGSNTLLIKTARREGNWDIGITVFDRNRRSGADEITGGPFPFEKNKEEKISMREGVLKGLLLDRSGYPKYARDYFLNIFENKPMNLLSKLFVAEAYKEAKEDGKYIDVLNLAILKTNSEVPAFLNRRGEFYSIKNQPERAEEDFKKVLELNDRSLRGYLNLARLYRAKNWDVDSRRVIQAALEIWGDSTLLMLEMGSLLERLGYHEDASFYYNRAARLYPGNSELHLRVTDFKRRKRDNNAALKWVEKAFRFDPFNRNIYFRLHELSRQLKNYQKAFEYLDMIEEFSPDNAFVHRKRGDLYYELLMPEKALESWEESYRLNPGDSYLSERIAFLKIEERDITLSFLPDEETIMNAVKKALDFEPHEGAESLLVYDHAACRINSDGSSIWVVTEVSRAINDTGRDNLINVFLPYGGRKKIINAYSLTPELRKSEASSVSTYDVRFRQLREGDFTVVQYVHYKPAPFYLENNFVGQWFIRSPYQHVLHSEWNLIYPQGKKLSIDIASERVTESKEKIENGLVVHTFKAENIEPLIHEYYSPPISDYLDTITVSTVESWDRYVSWERALLRDAFTATAEIRKKYELLTKESETVTDKIESVFAFVAQDIRYQQEYENIIAGVKPHTAAQTLERGYGDCKDKAVLFIQLLEVGGIRAKYAVVRTTDSGKLIKKVPGQQFNHAIVYIPKQEGIEEGFFMDPTVDLLEIGNLRSDNQGAVALILDHKTGDYKFKDVPYQPPEYNFQKHERIMKIEEDGNLIIIDEISLRGSLSSMLRQVIRTREVAYNMFRNLASALYKGGVLEKYENSDINDIKNPLKVTLTANVNSLKTEHSGRITISLPDQIVNPDLVSIKNRKTPLSTGIPSIYEVNTKFMVPEGMTVESMPEPLELKWDCFNIERTSHLEDDILHVNFVFRKECTIIELEDYPDFREQMLAIIKSQNALIVLLKD